MSLFAPLGLALGALALPLLALYFLKLRRRRVVVPSTMLWAAVGRSEQTARPFDRFRRNLLLWVQLLLLAALTFALARPYLETDAPLRASVVLVIDTSASMGATDGSPTRLDDAVDAATKVLDGLGAQDEALLVLAGPRTEVAVPFTRDHARVREALNAVHADQAEGSLRDGLQLGFAMARSRDDVLVAVFSDGGGGATDDLDPGKAEVRFVPVGRSSGNSGLIALDLRRAPANELERQLFVTAQSFGDRDVEADLRLFLDDRLLEVRSVRLAPQTPETLIFALQGGSSGVLRAELQADDDHLAADNTAWTVAGTVRKRRLLLVGGDWLTLRALSADPRVDLTAISPDLLPSTDLGDFDALLFAAPVPPAALEHPLAVLGPYPGAPVRFGAATTAPQVLGWRHTHPLLRSVALTDVAVAHGAVVQDSAGLPTLVDGDQGPLVLAGERGGVRVVQLAFDPLQSDLPLRVAWPVFLLNTVGWLTEGHGGDDPASLATGAVFTERIPGDVGAERVSATGPGGVPVAVDVAEGQARVRDTLRPGVYTVRAGERTATFAANLLSPREANLAPGKELALSSTHADASAITEVGRREIWRELVWLALGLLLLEWALWNRRRVA